MNEWTKDPEELAETFAAEIRHNMLTYSIWPGNYGIVIPKQLRDLFRPLAGRSMTSVVCTARHACCGETGRRWQRHYWPAVVARPGVHGAAVAR
jgi:hypothetical protein